MNADVVVDVPMSVDQMGVILSNWEIRPGKEEDDLELKRVLTTLIEINSQSLSPHKERTVERGVSCGT